MDIDAFNHLDRRDAARAIVECCGSWRWVDGMLERRPYRDSTALLMAAEEVWWDLGTEDWQEALGAHPDVHQDFSAKFGHPYVVHHNGRSVDELDSLFEVRLATEPMVELQTAATEQARITNQRLRTLFGL